MWTDQRIKRSIEMSEDYYDLQRQSTSVFNSAYEVFGNNRIGQTIRNSFDDSLEFQRKAINLVDEEIDDLKNKRRKIIEEIDYLEHEKHEEERREGNEY